MLSHSLILWRGSKTVLDCGLHAVDSGFHLLDSGSLSVELGFQIPKPTISDSTWKNFWTPLLATINMEYSTREVRPGVTHDDPQALETCTTVIWIDRLRNIKQRKCWQHSAGPKIGSYKKSLELITRTSSCVHLANSYDILFRQEGNVLLSPLTITETSVNTSSILL